VAVSPTVAVAVVELNVNVVFNLTAGAKGADKSPSPIAAITLNANRLKNVLLDIYFLSIVVIKTFPITAGKDIVLAS